MNDRQKTVLVHAINHFGVEANIDKALEEMGELTTELSRRRLPRYDKEKVAEEIADVLITVEKLRIIFGGSLVDEKVAEKLARLENEMDGDWRRQERMMPKGMVKHREEEESEARNGSLIGECVENGLMAGLKSIDPDLEEKIAKWANESVPTVVPEESIHVRPVSEVVDPSPLFAMLDSDKTRIPCCEKCGHRREEKFDGIGLPFCKFHGVLGGDIKKLCCTEYQRKEDGTNE